MVGLTALVAVGFLPSYDVSAQTLAPSQVTPEDLRPVRSPSGSISIPAAAGLTAPPGAATLAIILRGVSAEGAFPELAKAHEEMAAALKGKRVTVAEIFVQASKLERRYAEAGYVLVRLVVPPQKLDQGGLLTVKVIDGYIEHVEVKGVAQSQRDLVRRRMADLIGRKRMTQTELERRMLLVTELPGLKLRSTLAAGKATDGGTLIVLEGTHDVASGSWGGDNRSSQAMGGGSFNYSLALNSPGGFGEQYYMMASSGPDFSKIFDNTSPLMMVGGGVSLPIGNDGFVLNAEGVRSVTRGKPAPGSPRSVGTMYRAELRAIYPVLKTQTQSLTLQANYLWLEQSLHAIDFNTDLYVDRYSVFRLQADHRYVLENKISFNTVLTYSRGLGGRGQDAATASGIGLSRADAEPVFDKLLGILRMNAPMPLETQLSLTARAQTSFGVPLLTGESFALDGSDSVSGLTPGTLSADQGGTLRGEWSRGFATSLGGLQTMTSPYVFAASGIAFTQKPGPTQTARVTANTIGLGLRLNFGVADASYGASLGFELARSFVSVGESEVDRINLSASMRF